MGATLHVTVGIPGSGKSTWATNEAIEHGMSHLSSDIIRKELTGDETNQDANNQVFRTLHARIRQHLENGWSVIVDATNLKAANRKKLLDIADRVEVPAYAHRFAISLDYDECQKRNLARTRVVPEDVMRRFHQGFVDNCTTIQLEEEGWVVIEETV